MAIIFDTLLTKGVRAGEIPARTQQAREWYRDAAKNVNKVNENTMMKKDPSRMTTKLTVGSMYLFQYDPKFKKELPYYDTLPLIFPFKVVPGGFYGINLHYLPPQLRAKLMDALYSYTNNTKYDESTKLKITYNILEASARSNLIAPCVKHYLLDHTMSKFMYIYPSEWDIALFLPLARFQKRNANYVYGQSRKIINSRND